MFQLHENMNYVSIYEKAQLFPNKSGYYRNIGLEIKPRE